MSHSIRKNISSGTIWEERVGYSRAVRVGEHVLISGTTATTRDGGFTGEGDPFLQTMQVIENIAWSLEQAGSSLADVVRCRVYVVREEDWQEVGRALADGFGAYRPASTLVGVAWLVDPRMLVEIDADAVVGCSRGSDQG